MTSQRKLSEFWCKWKTTYVNDEIWISRKCTICTNVYKYVECSI